MRALPILVAALGMAARGQEEPPGADARLVLKGHLGPVTTLAFSPDGKTLASGSSDRTVRVWDIASGRELAPFSGEKARADDTLAAPAGIREIAFSPDGRMLAGLRNGPTLDLWDVNTRVLMRTLKSKDLTGPLRFDAKKKILHVGETKGLVAWDAVTGERLWLNEALGLTTDPGEGTQVFTAEGKSFLSVWAREIRETASGKLLKKVPDRPPVNSAAISPDGTKIAFYGAARAAQVLLIDVASGEERIIEELPRKPGVLRSRMAFSPDGQFLVWAGGTSPQSGGTGGALKRWDTAGGALLNRVSVESPHGFSSLTFSGDGTRLVTGSWSGTITCWEFREKEKD